MNNSPALYQIDDEYRRIAYLLDIATDEHDPLACNEVMLDDSLVAELDRLDGLWRDKVEAIVKYFKHLELKVAGLRGTLSQIDAERDRVYAQVKSTEGKVGWLKRYVLRSMNEHGEKKIEVGSFKLTAAKNSQPSIKFEGDPRTLPAWAQVITIDVNKAEIQFRWRQQQKAFENGAAFTGDHEIPEGVTIERGEHLLVK